ncbi:SGNH/GDSL hydrolase family protein [Pseudonocardia sp. S2-4]|uniref:SGNH/GDSL hydrolase family protein n=1 Tax=Pseudonocardia humida TaxID=2800819 RepID=A0ABT0ZWA7_9PSEU|nr:SGNH/GDSL hydrolase family protein [Pseudonocardia humida]
MLLGQGVRVRRRIPVLPEAAGPRAGSVGAGGPLAPAVLGESTAAGVGVERIEDGLATRLAHELADRGGRRVGWRVSARTGATAREARSELLAAAAAEPSDVAVVVLGVNDTLRLTGRAGWRRDVAAMVAALRAVQPPDGRVVLAGVPDLGAFPALPRPLRTVLGRHSRALDRELRALARAPGVLHAPVPTLTGADALATDGFHPGATSYRDWAAALADRLTP